ncbi:hypothetical protein APED_09720 [Acanthopleuribacter pedis]
MCSFFLHGPSSALIPYIAFSKAILAVETRLPNLDLGLTRAPTGKRSQLFLWGYLIVGIDLPGVLQLLHRNWGSGFLYGRRPASLDFLRNGADRQQDQIDMVKSF